MRRFVALLLAVVTVGCAGGDEGAAPTEPQPATTESQPTPTRTEALPPAPAPTTRDRFGVNVYFLRGERIAAATRDVPLTRAVARAAIAALLSGPDATERPAGLTTAIPAGTRLLDLNVRGLVATIDLSGEFERGGGSLAMRARVAQVVHTLTQFPTIRRVAFRIDGRNVPAIGGEGVVVDPPVGRAAFEDLAPAILVEWPGPGDAVDVPVPVRGTANTFEATLFLRIIDASGQTLVDQLVTASSGSGTRGTFSAALEVDGDGPATLVAYERSPENGEMTHVVRIPIQLTGG